MSTINSAVAVLTSRSKDEIISVATRYDETAESFLSFVDIASIRLWLRHLST